MKGKINNVKHRKPPKIHAGFTKRCHDIASKFGMDIPAGFILYGCDRRSGLCDEDGRITIPLWLDDREEGHLIQYIAHEIAHAYTWLNNHTFHHTADFMEWLMLLCPEDHWHWELGYRPREARKAGIVEKAGYTYNGYCRKIV